MMNLPRGEERLRSGRWSERGGTYFLTICTLDRAGGLQTPSLAAELRCEIESCEHDALWRVAGAVIMPDHVHLLVELTGNLPLSRIVARVKARSRSSLSALGLCWQGNFYDHRVRRIDSVDDILRYLLMNPYRAGLVKAEETYPWFWLHPREAEWFRPTLCDDRPFPEWMR